MARPKCPSPDLRPCGHHSAIFALDRAARGTGSPDLTACRQCGGKAKGCACRARSRSDRQSGRRRTVSSKSRPLDKARAGEGVFHIKAQSRHRGKIFPIRTPCGQYNSTTTAASGFIPRSGNNGLQRPLCSVGTSGALLLDAAHIVDDKDQRFGQPVIQNGIPLSKIHHAAFDAHLIGIDSGYRLHVSERLMVQTDGPMLEALKRLKGTTIHLPTRAKDRPDRDRLALRFERFRAAA